MNGLIDGAKVFLERHSATILTCLASVGVVGTAVLAVRATPKAVKILEQTKEEKGEDLTFLEIVRTAAPGYIPAAVVGLSTIACVFGANALNKSQQASIMSAYALLDKAYREYKAKLATVPGGKEANHKAREEIVKDKYREYDMTFSEENELFYEDRYGKIFERTREEVLRAEYQVNRIFAVKGCVSLNDFYKLLDIPPTDEGALLGWSISAGEAFYGYCWIDFEHTLVEMEDGMECCIIEMPFPPTANYLDDMT